MYRSLAQPGLPTTDLQRKLPFASQLGAYVETTGAQKAVHDTCMAYPGLDGMQKFRTGHCSIMLLFESWAQEHDASFGQRANLADLLAFATGSVWPTIATKSNEIVNQEIAVGHPLHCSGAISPARVLSFLSTPSLPPQAFGYSCVDPNGGTCPPSYCEDFDSDGKHANA